MHAGSCQNVVRLPHHDLTPGEDLDTHHHVVSKIACLQKCEDSPQCNSVVYSHECYTKAATASGVEPATGGQHDRLVILYCEHQDPGAACESFAVVPMCPQSDSTGCFSLKLMPQSKRQSWQEADGCRRP